MGTKAYRIKHYANHLVDLFNYTGHSPFYTQDVEALFNPSRMQMLVMSGIVEPTGRYYIGKTHYRRYNEWKFTREGVRIVESFKP